MRSPRLGQHFLTDSDILRRMIEFINPKAQDCFVEIGPGKGQLTRPLLASGAKVLAIELDRDLASKLSERMGKLNLSLTVSQKDAARGLPIPERGFWRAVGNLPYAISSPVLTRLPNYLPRLIDGHFMLQKEFAQRMAAQPGSRIYGRLSVAVQAFFSVEALFEVPANSFTPPPQVKSMVVRMRPLDEPKKILDHKIFTLVTRQAFAQRRKQLRNALGALSIEVPDNIAGLRAESLRVDQFIGLANKIATLK